jgi:hypothetical protein
VEPVENKAFIFKLGLVLIKDKLTYLFEISRKIHQREIVSPFPLPFMIFGEQVNDS